MDWDKLRIFHAVAKAGGFTHAEEILHIGHSSISRHISHLEHEMKTPLFHRHARGLKLTGAGEILFETVSEVYDKLDMAEARISDDSTAARGPLRVTIALGFGASWVINRIGKFIEKYPNMNMRLLLEDRMLDLAMGEADIAIRPVQQAQNADIISQPFLVFRYHLFASKEYLEKHGTPEKPEDLTQHKLIALDKNSHLPSKYFNWFLNYDGANLTPIFTVTSPFGIHHAVRQGFGIGVVSDLVAMEHSGHDADPLQVILSEYSSFDLQTYFAYPVELRNTERVKVFKKFMMEEAEKTQKERA